MLLVPEIETVPITCIFEYGSDGSEAYVEMLKSPDPDNGDLIYGPSGSACFYTNGLSWVPKP